MLWKTHAPTFNAANSDARHPDVHYSRFAPLFLTRPLLAAALNLRQLESGPICEKDPLGS